MSEDGEFRVRPGKAKRSAAQGRNARGLVAEVLRVAAKSGGGKRAGWGGSRRSGQSSFGRGRTSFARSRLFGSGRRVLVKALPECAARSFRMASCGAVRPHSERRSRCRRCAVERRRNCGRIAVGPPRLQWRSHCRFVFQRATRHAVRVPRPSGPTGMIGQSIPSSVRSSIVAGEGGNGRDRRGQDTRRTPICRKAEAFPWLHAGASVGERAARNEKPNNYNAPSGTIACFGRKAARR